jgi:hypothetical protein
LFQNQEKMTEQEMKKQAGGRHVEGLVMTFAIGEQGQDIVIDSAFSATAATKVIAGTAWNLWI